MSEEFERFLRVLDQYIAAQVENYLATRRCTPVLGGIPVSEDLRAKYLASAAEKKGADLEVVFGSCLVAALKQRHNQPGELREMLLNVTAEAEPSAQAKPEPTPPPDEPRPEPPAQQGGGWNVEIVKVPPGSLKDV